MKIKLKQDEQESIQEHLSRLVELSNLVQKTNTEIGKHQRDLELAWTSVCQRHMLETKDYEFQAPPFIDNAGSTNISLRNDIAGIPEKLIQKNPKPEETPDGKPVIASQKIPTAKVKNRNTKGK